jgi:CIC family chloride channel protein
MSIPLPSTPSPYRLVASLRLALLAAAVGAISAYAALGFVLAISAVQTVAVGIADANMLSEVAQHTPWRIVLAPAVGGLLVGLLVHGLMRSAPDQGPASVVEAVHIHDGTMPLRRGFVSALASIISIGSGASVGRYGPQVHLGATLGSWVGRYFSLERNGRVALLGAGVAAAIAAAFNAPLAGVLFAHEVVIRRFAARAVMPTVVGAAVGAGVARAHGHALPLFGLTDQGVDFAYEYPLFVVIGLLGGALAIFFMRALDLATRHVPKLPLPPWLRPAAGGVLIGCIALAFPQTFGLGEHVIHGGLLGSHALWVLLALIPAKILATSCSVGFGFYGAVLGPALFIGTLMGEAFGVALGQLLPGQVSGPAVYAVVGMGVVVSRVVGAPIATILIVFELTSSYTLTTAAMIAVVVASVVRSERFPGSLFQYQLALRGVDTNVGREVVLLQQQRVAQYMRPCISLVAQDSTVADGLELLLDRDGRELMLTDADGHLVGIVTLASLVRAQRDGKQDERLVTVSARPSLVLSDSMDLNEAMRKARDFPGLTVPVVHPPANALGDTPLGGAIVGIVYPADLILGYDNAVETARREEFTR